jgi:NDP-sugar pyrophosphorylase family protein
MRAIILAGGKGTRLMPYTTVIPKPLVPIGGKYAILEIIIMQLTANGFNHITLAVNHLSNLIMAYFGDGSKYGIKIDYSIEKKELSTIGPLTLIEDLPENFLVMNGDILSDIKYSDLLKKHIQLKNNITVSTYNRESKIDFGVINKNELNLLTSFIEKPKLYHEVSMGVYCLNKNVIDSVEKGKVYGFDTLMHDSIKNDVTVFLNNHVGFWLDIGRPEDYDYANNNFHEILKNININF